MIIILINLLTLMFQLHAGRFLYQDKILQIQLVYVSLNYLYNAIMIKLCLIYRWIIYFIPYM